jgi:hypothetical protein
MFVDTGCIKTYQNCKSTWPSWEDCHNIHAQFHGLFGRSFPYSYSNQSFEFIWVLLSAGVICLTLNCFFGLSPYPTLNISCYNCEKCFFAKSAFVTQKTQTGNKGRHEPGIDVTQDRYTNRIFVARQEGTSKLFHYLCTYIFKNH